MLALGWTTTPRSQLYDRGFAPRSVYPAKVTDRLDEWLPTILWEDGAMSLSSTDMIAGIALLISALTAFITWKNHHDSGGRVTVRMNAAAYVPFSGTGSLRRNDAGTFLLEESPEPSVELAQIIIDNPGRTGVTITGVSLRVEGLNRGTYRVTPRSFLLEGFGAEDARPETYFRIEPYDRRTVIFDYWSVVDAEFDKDPSLQELTIHAEVTVAGHDDPFDSKHHGHWRIKRTFVSAVGGHTLRRPRNIILTEFLRHSLRGDLSRLNYMDQFAVTAEDTIGPSWSYSEVEDHLKRLMEDPMDLVHLSDEPIFHHLAVLEIWNQLQRLGRHTEPFPLLNHRAMYYTERGLTPRADTKDDI
jgi:hypothetical protein